MVSLYLVYLEDINKLRRNSSVQSQELTVDHATQRKEIEGFHEEIVDFLVELLQALVSEKVIGGKLSALVVSSQQKDLVRVSDF